MALDHTTNNKKITSDETSVFEIRTDSNHHLILKNMLLVGQNVGIKGYLIRIRDEALAEINKKRKKRKDDEKLVDDFAAFLALQQSLAASLSILSQNLDHKIGVMETAIERLKKDKNSNEQTIKIMQNLKEDAELQQESVARSTNRHCNKAQYLGRLQEIQAEIKRKKALFASLLDRFSEWRKAKASFDHEAYVRPDVREEEELESFYDSIYEDLINRRDKSHEEIPKDDTA